MVDENGLGTDWHLPWWRALRRNLPGGQPISPYELHEWIQTEDPDGRFPGTGVLANYLSMAADALTSHPARRWESVQALGPFTSRRTRPQRVPLIVVLAPYARVASQLLVLGDTLA